MNYNYPSQINPLTGLRFFAAFWLLLYFFQGRVDIPTGLDLMLIKNGYLGVDLFFILSGFVLAHVYGPQFEDNKYSHSAFLWARFSRVYPLHFATLFMMLGLFAIAVLTDADFDKNAFSVSHLPFHLTLTQAWGFVDADSWNFPSWSISSEWFAYLSFPLMFAIASKFKNSPISGLLLAVTIFYLFYGVTAMMNTELTNMTWEGGVVRIIPSFFGGIMLWFFGRKNIIPAKWARSGVYLSLISLLIVASIGHFPWAVWFILMSLVFFLAETAKLPNRELIGSKTWVYLGEISFAMYMVHLPVDIIYYRIVGKLVNLDGFGITLFAMFGAILITMIAAAIAHKFIEKPMRELFRKMGDFRKVEKNEILPIEFVSFGLVKPAK